MKNIQIDTCFSPADILLPIRTCIEKGCWATLACDQFTSEPAYWEEADRIVGSEPSTLRLMLPEVWLGEAESRLPAIHAAMRAALSDTLQLHPDAMIAVSRTQTDGSVRHGLVGKVDLEQYRYEKGADSLIRATEGTVLERIPPRVAIRRDATLELPHVMLLIDDPEKTVLEPLFAEDSRGQNRGSDRREVAYDCDLMLGGGHIRGTFLTGEEKQRVSTALSALVTPEKLAARYGDGTIAPLLFAVGDGNHSLASAKAYYEEVKAQLGEAALQHPARYALCEVVNLHDDALSFEPIYRVVFGAEPEALLSGLAAYLSALSGTAEPQSLTAVGAFGERTFAIPHPVAQLTVGTLQTFLDAYLAAHPGVKVDYIHGEDSLRTLAAAPGVVGFLFAGMEKRELFRTVLYDGALPRKTFSMGHARDKRYYMECRKIQ